MYLFNMLEQRIGKSKIIWIGGFTLIESLVAVSLFVLVMTAALGLFVVYSKAQKETGLRQKVINQLSVEIEKIAKDIRLNKLLFSGSANYKSGSLYGGSINGKETDLGFSSGIRYFYFPQYGDITSLNCAGKLPSANYGYLYKYNNSSDECEPIFLISEIKLIDVGFYISPSYNPYPQADSDCKTIDVLNEIVFNGYYCTCWQDSQCYSNNCSEDSVGPKSSGFCYVSQPSVTVSVTAQIGADTANIVTMQTTVSSRVYQ